MRADGTSVLLDGGKRDRVVWPGDIVVSGPSIFVSTNSLEPIRNALDSLFLYQKPDGRLPAAGYPLAELFAWSFTYHCHTLNDAYDYFLFTGDVDYITSLWNQYRLGVDYLLQFIDSSGLANVTSISDWGRSGMSGHNIEVGVHRSLRVYAGSNKLLGELNIILHSAKCRQARRDNKRRKRIHLLGKPCGWHPRGCERSPVGRIGIIVS